MLLVGAPSPSPDFPNYDSVVVTIDNGEKKQDLTFLISKDRSSMMRMTKFDLNKDPFAADDEQDQHQRAANAGGESIQGCGGEFRRFRVPVLLAHAPDAVFRRFSRSMATGSLLFTRTIR